MVIELNLCPFAQRVFQADRIRYVVSDAQEETSLLQALADELDTLASAPISSVETTLLIHPRVFADFLDFNDFLGEVEQLVQDAGCEGDHSNRRFSALLSICGNRAGRCGKLNESLTVPAAALTPGAE